MNTVSRRDSLKILTVGVTGLSSMAALTGGNVDAQDKSPFSAFRAQHQPKPLSFDPSKLKGLSEKLIRSHWENNYGGSVKALNVLEQRLDAMMKEKELPPFIYGPLKREELLRTGSIVLHEHYFDNLGGDGKAGGGISTALSQGFGSQERWAGEFSKTAMSLAGGSGWAILGYNLHTRELHNYWAWDHMHNAPATLPLLVLDMYEHSFHMDYGAAAAKYVDAFMQNVKWEEVDRRYTAARKVAESMTK